MLQLCPQEYCEGTVAVTLDSCYWLLIMLALEELLTLIQLLLSLTPSGLHAASSFNDKKAQAYAVHTMLLH